MCLHVTCGIVEQLSFILDFRGPQKRGWCTGTRPPNVVESRVVARLWATVKHFSHCLTACQLAQSWPDVIGVFGCNHGFDGSNVILLIHGLLIILIYEDLDVARLHEEARHYVFAFWRVHVEISSINKRIEHKAPGLIKD